MKLTPNKLADQRGFTLVEILIVLVIIALLVIGSVPFIGRAQSDARDDRREADVATIRAALESYYLDNGEYPAGQGSSVINNSWSTTADDSWNNLANKLVPKYIKELPSDPSGDKGTAAMSGGLAYEYFSNSAAGVTYCGKSTQQMYILLYNFEVRERKLTLTGGCSSSALGPYPDASNYRMTRDNT